jgi:hypothetical protein
MLRAPGVRSKPAAVSAAVLAAAVLLVLGCAGPTRLELARGDPEGKSLAPLVDSEPARRLLVDLLTRRAPDPRLAALAPSLLGSDLFGARGAPLAPDSNRLPDQARLRALGLEVSLDFAALAFARALGADERSRAVQAAFDRALDDGVARSEELVRRPGAFPYTVLFAPAWLYRGYPENGADFARQRRLLDRLGITNRLIPSEESASVEDNAAIIAEAVREATRAGGEVVLVSTSKSGAEVGHALSRVLTPDETSGVAAWLNAGGALRGTPLADDALRPPNSWIARCVFWVTGWRWDGLTSMTTAASRKRLEGQRLPDSIAVVNLVAVPVSGTVGPKLLWTYRTLRRNGPNDGVVLLADAVWPGGANLVALGSDHFLVALQADAHGLALLRAMDVAIRLAGLRRTG